MLEDHYHNNYHHCTYADELRQQMSLGWHNLVSMGIIKGTDEELMDYVYNGLVDLVLHEVGHTLGLRHNFKASSIYSVEQLSNKNFTEKYGRYFWNSNLALSVLTEAMSCTVQVRKRPSL